MRLLRGVGFAALGLLVVFKVVGGFLLSAGLLKLVLLVALFHALAGAPALVALVALLVVGGIVGSLLLS